MDTRPLQSDKTVATTGGSSQREKRRYAKDDALSARNVERLLRATRKLDDPFEFEARFCIFASAKLGMRAGEIAHMKSDWINWSTKMIEVPEYDPCTKGKNGGVCGYCRGRVKDRLLTNNLTLPEAKEIHREAFDGDVDEDVLNELAAQLCEETNITYRDALAERWNPKTPNSVRSIPFDFDVRTEMCIEEFADQYDIFPKSKPTINRRINRVAEAAEIQDRVYPHSLRATSASMHASRGVSPYSLMSIMGWVDITTARSYIQSSDETAAKEIRSKHR